MYHIWSSYEGGSYRMCFQNHGSQYLFFEFTIKTGIDAKNYDELVTEKDLKPVELSA